MPRASNFANSIGCAATKVTKATRIFALGHLATHVDAKVAMLRAEGFSLAEPMYAQLETLEEMKSKLRASSGALLFVGGAMMHTHPDMMKALFEFVQAEAPTTAVDVVHMPDFAAACPGRTPPFTADEVGLASLYAVKEIAAE